MPCRVMPWMCVPFHSLCWSLCSIVLRFETMTDEERLKVWTDCRNMLGIHLVPEKDLPNARQQFMRDIEV